MNYDDFHTLWHEALSAARLLPFLAWPSETIDLHGMSRTYSILISWRDVGRTRPFYVTTTQSWQWDALRSARTATTEEDLSIELLGQDGHYLITERAWLRVDVTLDATLPADSPIPLPDVDTWQRWVAEVTRRLAPLLPTESSDLKDERSLLLSWRGDPVARLLVINAFILDFLCIHPFPDGNGRLARLLTLLLLYTAGYEVGRYIGLERIIEGTRETYYEALRRSSQRWDVGQHDLTPLAAA